MFKPGHHLKNRINHAHNKSKERRLQFILIWGNAPFSFPRYPISKVQFNSMVSSRLSHVVRKKSNLKLENEVSAPAKSLTFKCIPDKFPSIMSAIFLPEDVRELLKGKTVIYIGDSGMWYLQTKMFFYVVGCLPAFLGLCFPSTAKVRGHLD